MEIPKPRYQRRGECTRCGKCCLVEDPPCPHLEWNGKTAVCKIFGKSERPERCKLFPELPPLPFEGCGYYFEDTWNNNKIVRRHV